MPHALCGTLKFMKKQILIIHGGDTYDTYDGYVSALRSVVIEDLSSLKKGGWKENLEERLGSNEYDVILLKMPNKGNAKYLEWKIWFEKIIHLLDEKVVLIGHSLGGIFLAKHLSENRFPRIVVGTILIAAPYDDTEKPSLGGFVLPANLQQFVVQSPTTILFHSKDDYVVPFTDLEKYKKQLPQATTKVFETKGHFNQEEFPELIETIKSLHSF